MATPPTARLAAARRPTVPVVDGTRKSSDELRAELEQLLEEDRRRAAEQPDPAGEPSGRWPRGSVCRDRDPRRRGRRGGPDPGQRTARRPGCSTRSSGPARRYRRQRRLPHGAGTPCRRRGVDGARRRAGEARGARRGGRGAGPGPARPPVADQEMTHADPASTRRAAGAVRPMLAVPGTLPSAPGWAFEFKWDGVRAIVAAGPDRCGYQPQRQRRDRRLPGVRRSLRRDRRGRCCSTASWWRSTGTAARTSGCCSSGCTSGRPGRGCWSASRSRCTSSTCCRVDGRAAARAARRRPPGAADGLGLDDCPGWRCRRRSPT